MPLYEYRCVRCDAAVEAFATMANAAKPTGCPECGGLAERTFSIPHVDTDTTAYSGDRTGGRQFKSKAMREFHEKKARKAGVNVTGKMYNSQLANFPGDPAAWVGSDDDIKQVLKHRGWGGKGKVKVDARESDRPPPPSAGISEKVVAQHVAERLFVDPGQKFSKVVEDVVTDHAPRGAQRILPCRKGSRKTKGNKR